MTNDRDIWRAEYTKTLYFRKAHDAVLSSRYVSLISNLWTTDQAGNAVALRSMERHKEDPAPDLRRHARTVEARDPMPGELSERALRDEATASYIRPKLKAPIIGGPGESPSSANVTTSASRSTRARSASPPAGGTTATPRSTPRRPTRSSNTSPSRRTSTCCLSFTGSMPTGRSWSSLQSPASCSATWTCTTSTFGAAVRV